MSLARPDLVIFDCDGVLVDSEPITSRVIAHSLSRYGLSISAEEVDRLFTGGTLPRTRDAAQARGAALPEDWVAEAGAEILAALRETPIVEGVADVLDALDAAGVPFCVGSNGRQEKMDVTLAATGLAPRFVGRRFSIDDVAAGKPAPDLFLLAAERMGVAPTRCVVVGDTLNDAKAAAAAGMPCFGYAVATVPAEAFQAHGAHPFASMSALPALLDL